MRSLHVVLPAALTLCLTACAGPARRGSSSGATLAETARGQLGARYKFGGRSPGEGFDCSGLAWWTHSRHGLRIPATSFGQFEGGRKIGRKRLMPGDLLFFTTYREGPSHVGVYTGRGTFIHAPKDGSRVREDRLSDAYWERRYLGARRYLPE